MMQGNTIYIIMYGKVSVRGAGLEQGVTSVSDKIQVGIKQNVLSSHYFKRYMSCDKDIRAFHKTKH